MGLPALKDSFLVPGCGSSPSSGEGQPWLLIGLLDELLALRFDSFLGVLSRARFEDL